MFSHLRRLPLRRCLHTQTPRIQSQILSSRVRLALGASAAVTSFVIWRLTWDQRIALDSATSLKPSKKPVLDGPSPDISHSHTSEFDAKPDTSPESESDAKSDVPSESEKTEAEGEQSADGASQGAFNPVTGEINWDCPCLGGMAHGPCGPEFREAFSCFVFSEEEPKGINCVEKFQAMQTCFRAHPEVYADEIMDDDEDQGQSSPESAEVEKTAESPTAEPENPPLPSPQKPVPTPEVSS